MTPEDEISDDDVYGDSREDLVENDELSPEEEAFMAGYDEAADDSDSDDEEEKDAEE